MEQPVKFSEIMTTWYQKLVLVFLLISGLFVQVTNAQGREKQGREKREESVRPGNGQSRNNNVLRHESRQVTRANSNRVNQPERNINNRVTTNRPQRNVNNLVTVNRTVNNNYNRRPVVYNAGNPNWRYANLPRRNSVRVSFPPTCRVINYGGFGYRYYHGLFYRPYNNAFMLVAPPIGIFIDILPVGYRRIYVRDYPYYYYNGTYYDYQESHYRVVSPPVGAVVESLPDGYNTVVIDGETYYTVDGAQYKPVVQDNGEIWYEVIKAN